MAGWRVKSLVLGVILILAGWSCGLSVVLIDILGSVALTWSLQAVFITSVVTLLPVTGGVFLLLQLCVETEEDRQYQAEFNRLARDLELNE